MGNNLKFRCNYVNPDNNVGIDFSLNDGVATVSYSISSEDYLNGRKESISSSVSLSEEELETISRLINEIVDYYKTNKDGKMESGCEFWSLSGVSSTGDKITRFGNSSVRTQAERIVNFVREKHSEKFNELDQQLKDATSEKKEPFCLRFDDNYYRSSLRFNENGSYSLKAGVKQIVTTEGDRSVVIAIKKEDEEMVSTSCANLIGLVDDSLLLPVNGKPSMTCIKGFETKMCMADNEMLVAWNDMLNDVARKYPEMQSLLSAIESARVKKEQEDQRKISDREIAKKKLKELMEKRPEYFEEDGSLSIKGIEALLLERPQPETSERFNHLI